MKKVTYFHLDTCPYCRQADEVIEELVKEHPEYGAVEFERINEYEQPEIADNYEYDVNPCMFIGEEKVYEGHLFEKKPEAKEKIEAVMKKALEA